MQSLPTRRAAKIPAYCLHKQTGAAYVTLNGKQHRLGKHGTPESRQNYARLIAEWSAGQNAEGQRIKPETMSVHILLSRFLEHAISYYRKPDGGEAEELSLYRYAMRLMNHLYGQTPAIDFGPRALKALREAMIRPLQWTHPETGENITHVGWCRKTTNRQIHRIQHIFRWAAEDELLPGSIYQNLRAVAGLKRGRSDARETAPVKPAAADIVAQALEFLPPPVRAMVELEGITGARGNELCQMRGRDIDRTNPDCWVFTPAAHKTEHHGHARKIPLGKLCQQILAPFLNKLPDAYLFSPADAEKERRAENHAQRATPASYGNRPGTNRRRNPQWKPGDRYDRHSYAKAITRACEKAFPPPAELARLRIRTGKTRARMETRQQWRNRLGPEKWAQAEAWRKSHRFTPHQLRHSAATRLRKQFGLEAAKVILGHQSISMTELYAEQDHELAIKVMAEVG